MNSYEIYTKNPTTGETGWDIHFVEAENREAIEQFPNFDCVILVNDTPANFRFDHVNKTIQTIRKTRTDGIKDMIETVGSDLEWLPPATATA